LIQGAAGISFNREEYSAHFEDNAGGCAYRLENRHYVLIFKPVKSYPNERSCLKNWILAQGSGFA